MLQPLKSIFEPDRYPEVLVGLAKADDAAVYKLADDRAIVATTDFFPPVVDDPYDFGAIAAANALSDIYAMGAHPLFAINLVAFPDGLDMDNLREILRGGAEKVAEAGAAIAGGHSVTDREPKYGLAVIGQVDPALLLTKSGADPGDSLLLTKPLGTGIITTALKREMADEQHVAEAVASMKTLNNRASEAARAAGARSVTDVTGFGLLGHAHEMAHLGHVAFHFELGRLRFLSGALAYGRAGAFPGGMANNREYFQPWVTFDPSIGTLMQDMLWTPETSGGLLVAVKPDAVEQFVALCPAEVVGHVSEGDGQINVAP